MTAVRSLKEGRERLKPIAIFSLGMFKGPFDPFERTAAVPTGMLFPSIEENKALCHIFEISCGTPSHTRPWALRRASKLRLPGLPAGVGGVGCSSPPGRPSPIENDFIAACAQYLSTLRKRKSDWCPRHATRRQPARRAGPGPLATGKSRFASSMQVMQSQSRGGRGQGR